MEDTSLKQIMLDIKGNQFVMSNLLKKKLGVRSIFCFGNAYGFNHKPFFVNAVLAFLLRAIYKRKKCLLI